MQTFDEDGIEKQAAAVTVALTDLPDVTVLLETALPWLVEVGERSPGARSEAIGAILVGHSAGPEKLREAIEEWRGFLQPMKPWRTDDA